MLKALAKGEGIAFAQQCLEDLEDGMQPKETYLNVRKIPAPIKIKSALPPQKIPP